jgi:hypothetical protein
MLTQFVIDLLMGCSLLLFAGWVQDAVCWHARVDQPQASTDCRAFYGTRTAR